MPPLAGAQRQDSLVDTCAASDGLLGFFDPPHPLLAMGVGETVEEPPCVVMISESGSQIVGDGHLPRCAVKSDVDIDVISGPHAGGPTILPR